MHRSLLAAALAAGAAAADAGTLANLRFADQRLELHPFAGVGGGWDSAPDAGISDRREWRGNLRLGLDAGFALTPVDQLDATAEVDPTWTNLSSNRPDRLYRSELRSGHRGPGYDLDLALAARRDDAYEIRSGTRAVTDVVHARAAIDRDSPTLHLGAGAVGDRTRYHDVEPGSGLEGRDNRSGQVFAEAGPRFGRFTVSPRLTLEATRYDQPDPAQDSDGVIAALAVGYVATGRLELHAHAGWQWRRYQPADALPGGTTTSPNGGLDGEWRLDPRTTATLSATGGLEDSLTAQSAFSTALEAGLARRLGERTRGTVAVGWRRSHDVDLAPGQIGDDRVTTHLALGCFRTLRPGLVLSLEGRVERARAEVTPDYDRVTASAELTARF